MKINRLIILFTIALLCSCSTSKKFSNGTIYKTDENQERIYSLYNAKLATWPVPYEEIEIRSEYGTTSIIASGDPKNPPVLLIHAMGVTATMWQPNVAALSKNLRVYAINTIGDLGKSKLYDLDYYPKNGQDYSHWLNHIMKELHLTQCDVIAASMGGWIAMNFASYSPDKIEHLILLGPMGIKANTMGVMRRLFKVIFFPNQKNKEAVTKWTLGDDEHVNEEMAEYMNTAMNCEGRLPIPSHIGKRQLSKIEAKTLLILGEYDNPIGKPEKNKRFANKSFEKINTEVVKTGHLMNMEDPQTINSLMLDFLNK
jgi:pimeloyl-ACP methyl ester carboxylesterase